MAKTKGKARNRRKIRFAVVGLGHIAQEAVLPAFAHASAEAELVALVSGDKTKLKSLGRKYGVQALYGYEEFDSCLASGEIDALYISLPNSLHAAYAIRALEEGVHVLCEKPMALTEEDCRLMLQAAETSGAKLMIAYRLHFDEANLKAIELAHKRIGELRIFNSTFTFQVKDPDNVRLKASEGTSPLWDIGIYCINAARAIFADEPEEVFALSANGGGECFAEVDEMTAVTLKFPQERLANFVCSFGAADCSTYEAIGTKGSIRLDEAYSYAEERELALAVGEKEETFRFGKTDQFAAEIVYFADCVRHGRDPEPSGVEGWADARVIRACEESLRTGHPVLLEEPPLEILAKVRPSLRQRIRRPPVKKPPELVHVASPD